MSDEYLKNPELEFNPDQLKVILSLQNPQRHFPDDELGLRGLTWKQIISVTELTIEKTLLSLGWLEALGHVKHDVGIQKKTIDYLGRSNVTIPGQRIVRVFFLTKIGRKAAKKLSKE